MVNPYVLTGIFFAISIVLSALAYYKVFRIANTVLTILGLALAIGSLALSYDSQQFEQQLAYGTKLFVLDDKGTMLGAFVHDNSPMPGVINDTSALRAAYSTGDFKTALDGNNVMLILNPGAFDSIPFVHIDGLNLSSKRALELMAEADPRMDYAKEVRTAAHVPIGQEIQLPDTTADAFKGLLLAAMVNDFLQAHALVKSINAGTARAYPGSITTRTIRILPYPVLRYVINVDGAS
jgi:hypothetical protein